MLAFFFLLRHKIIKKLVKIFNILCFTYCKIRKSMV